MKFDEAQIAIIKKLDLLAHNIEKNFSKKPSIFNKFLALFNKKIAPNNEIKDFYGGFYIYGDVGRGKTMLMQNFYKKVNKIQKNYFHFNAFMILIHQNLHKIRVEKEIYKDELLEAVLRIIKDTKLICFDEFQIVDVADAMLLSRIFEFFFVNKIIVVMTSNSHPQNLYQNGLQREVFLQFVNNILLKNIEVLNLNSNIDYREFNRSKIVKRFFVSNQKNREIFAKIIDEFTRDKVKRVAKIKVWGREIKVKKSYQNIAIFNFEELFMQNYSSADYKALCKKYDLIFLKKLPNLTKDNLNEIRRFTLFIDEIYESKKLLLILSKVNLLKLNVIAGFAPYFARTLSRINEIICDEYWQENSRQSKIFIN